MVSAWKFVQHSLVESRNLCHRHMGGLALARKDRGRIKIALGRGEEGAQFGHVVRAGALDADAGHKDRWPRGHAVVAGLRCRMKAASASSDANASTPAARLSIFTP